MLIPLQVTTPASVPYSTQTYSPRLNTTLFWYPKRFCRIEMNELNIYHSFHGSAPVIYMTAVLWQDCTGSKESGKKI